MTEATRERNGTKEVSVNFSGDAYQALEELAERKNKSVGDVAEDAISLLLWYQNVKRDGGEVFFEQKDGKTGRLVFEP